MKKRKTILKVLPILLLPTFVSAVQAAPRSCDLPWDGLMPIEISCKQEATANTAKQSALDTPQGVSIAFVRAIALLL
ncbi:hypothetical protein Rin_00011140 [Candidatus Regiella insecticola 5.15]|uniref:Uncharacterized protein n=1 Tax=Candidatus Regiella insecticola 5.15 TaxID=1005043 RepID=G2GZ99_9ENTR|nr:hypothetical protein [Candidatus Regiella insecticola]EGY28931.1 hypothetical protein Rin_00011140 [Candidatus Regiella insecticola 5.15]